MVDPIGSHKVKIKSHPGQVYQVQMSGLLESILRHFLFIFMTTSMEDGGLGPDPVPERKHCL